jgi:hypothetical protein
LSFSKSTPGSGADSWMHWLPPTHTRGAWQQPWVPQMKPAGQQPPCGNTPPRAQLQEADGRGQRCWRMVWGVTCCVLHSPCACDTIAVLVLSAHGGQQAVGLCPCS